MPTERFTEYKGREIAVTVTTLLDNRFRIERIGLWSHDGQRTGYTKLTASPGLTFATRAEAEEYGLAFAQEAIDGGV